MDFSGVFEAFPNVLSLVQKKSDHKHNYDDKLIVFNGDKLWGPMALWFVVWEKTAFCLTAVLISSSVERAAQINAETT